MILGLRTAIYPVADLSLAREWYSRVLGIEPYFDEPYYIGFSVGGFELGLIPDGIPGANGVQVYWGVDSIEREFERLTGFGATVHEPINDVGGGIRVGSFFDPFGNIVSIIENPSFDPAIVR